MDNDSHLYILWTTGDAITAQKMVLMYGGNSLLKGWWDNVTIIIWGAADELASSNPAIQERMKELMDMGVKFTACKSCAESLGVSGKLRDLGVEVKYWGEALTKLLKSNASILSI